MWISDEVYVQFINFIDNDIDPILQVTLSMDTMLNYADNNQIDIGDIFTTMSINELLYLIRIRRISPWILLLSKKFKQLVSGLSHEQQLLLLNTPIQTRNKIAECVIALDI
jgi:hypothetical protein